MNSFLEDCRAAIGAAHVITAPSDMAAYLTDWRKRFTGSATAIVKPGSTEEVAAIVANPSAFLADNLRQEFARTGVKP